MHCWSKAMLSFMALLRNARLTLLISSPLYILSISLHSTCYTLNGLVLKTLFMDQLPSESNVLLTTTCKVKKWFNETYNSSVFFCCAGKSSWFLIPKFTSSIYSFNKIICKEYSAMFGLRLVVASGESSSSIICISRRLVNLEEPVKYWHWYGFWLKTFPFSMQLILQTSLSCFWSTIFVNILFKEVLKSNTTLLKNSWNSK